MRRAAIASTTPTGVIGGQQQTLTLDMGIAKRSAEKGANLNKGDFRKAKKLLRRAFAPSTYGQDEIPAVLGYRDVDAVPAWKDCKGPRPLPEVQEAAPPGAPRPKPRLPRD